MKYEDCNTQHLMNTGKSTIFLFKRHFIWKFMDSDLAEIHGRKEEFTIKTFCSFIW